METTSLIATYGYGAILLGSLLDGETSVVLAGIATANGHLALPAVIFLAAAVNLAWDQFYFWLGRRHGATILIRYPKLQPGVARVNRHLERHQRLFIVAMRFIVGLRVAGPIALGIGRVHPVVFTTHNTLGALLWAVVFAGSGRLFGMGLDLNALERSGITAIVVGILFGAIAICIGLRHREVRRIVST